MKLRPVVIELVVSDPAATLAFYRRLGLDVPSEADDLERSGHTTVVVTWRRAGGT